ncbi:MAG: T9SS type A sorting domain-containing protein [Cryomorphaceae bacterium]|nr:T9SS type A sorting domain-containing protein [Cryomorphaceae bacterium]
MQKVITRLFFTGCIVAVILIHFSNSYGRNGQYSGSPGDNGITCINCHAFAGQVQHISNAITTNMPGGEYTPGDTFTVTLTISHPTNNVFGFQVTAEDSNDAKVGTFITTNASSQVVNGGNAATHTTAGNQGTNNSRTWEINWIAPAAGTGDVTFYAAFNASNGNNGNQTISNSNHTVSESTAATPFILTVNFTDETCPGACDGTITPTASGGEGPPYNFTITGGSDENLCPGSYTITAFDSQNNSTQTTITIGSGEPAPTQATLSQVWDRVEATSPNAVSYRWFINGNIIPGADSSWVFITQNGYYQAEALSATGCGVMSDSLAVNNFSVSKNAIESIKVYPNPGREFLSWDSPIRVQSIQLIDMRGRTVLHHQTQANEVRLKLSQSIKSGRYIVHFQYADGRTSTVNWEKL